MDVLPATQRRVKLIKSDKDMPLGFYIRDGYNVYPNSSGQLEKVYGIFISKLLPGGLAAGTGLLAVNDEILEVNGIEVAGKTLDQVGYFPSSVFNNSVCSLAAKYSRGVQQQGS